MDVVNKVLEVFTDVGLWISDSVTNFTTIFYNAETGLTFMGVLAVAGLAFSVSFLIIGIIQRFLKFGA